MRARRHTLARHPRAGPEDPRIREVSGSPDLDGRDKPGYERGGAVQLIH
jgi:hypothetical protein